MVLKDTEKEFSESDALQYESNDTKATESSSSLDDPFSKDNPEATKGYISKFPFITWTLVAVIGIAFCLIHSHQESLWKWTGATAADAQSLQAKVVVSLFSAVIGGCLVAVLSKALVSVSFVIFRYRGASFSYLTTVIEGYAASRILTLVSGGRWVSSILIISILVISVVTKQIAVVSMGVELMATNSTKVSYSRNYTDCEASWAGGSVISAFATSITTQTFNAILTPNSSYTNEAYDSSIPPGLAGYSQFERVLLYAESSCVQFNSSHSFGYMTPVVNDSRTWQTEITLPFTNTAGDSWINCTIRSGAASAKSTCNDTKCETIRTSNEIAPLKDGGKGPPTYLQELFNTYTPKTSKVQNIIVTWILGGDILRKTYLLNDDLPTTPTPESIANRLATLGTVMTRVLCDANYALDENNVKTTPITSKYIEYSYYQYRLLWRWPFYVLAGCIFVLWVLCMISMWLAPESRVLSIDWLLNQYISRHQHGYLSGTDLLKAHNGVRYQVYDDNAIGEVGNIVISPKESFASNKYDRVIQYRRYQ